MLLPWTVLEKKWDRDYRLFKVQTRKVRSPRTGHIHSATTLHFPDWVIVLPVTENNEVVMVRQYRHGTEQIGLELPGGLLDPEDPSPAETARRELREETGFASEKPVLLGACFPQPAVLTNKCYFYLAEKAFKVGPLCPDDGEDIEVVLIPLADIPEKIAQHEIQHGMVLLAFSFFRQYTEKKHDAMTH